MRVAWSEEEVAGTNEIDVRMARFRQDGGRVVPSDGELVSSVSNAQLCMGFAQAPTSRDTLVLWQDFRKGSFDDTDIYGAVVESDGWLFGDGFELGDLSVWSSATGTP